MLSRWWTAADCIPMSADALPATTFIVSLDNVPAASVSLYLTNCPAIGWMEALVGNPELKGPSRASAVRTVVAYAEQFAMNMGVRRLMAFAEAPALKKYYQEKLGYTQVIDNVALLAKGDV